MSSIRVEHADGSAETLGYLSSRWHRWFGKVDLLRLFTPRDDANGITLTEGEDEVFLEDGAGSDVAGGLLKDVERGGSAVELVVDGWERYAKEAPPTPKDEHYQNVADDTVVSDAISDVPELTAGTVSNQKSGLSFVFPSTTQAKKIRTVEEATPGEVQYNVNKSVDYVDRLGSDKSASITISPGNQNLDGKIKVKQQGGDTRVTHLRMLGAGEGKHQVAAHIVPSADTASYENKTTYSSSWSAGDREVWQTYINKDLTDATTLAEEGLTLIQELNTEHLELEATIKGPDVELGDSVHVEKPKDDIDQDLRIVEWTRVDDAEGLRYECVLSTRQKSREAPGSKERKDVQRFNKGFEGNPVMVQAGGNRMPVDDSHNWELSFYYPGEVVQELRAQLNVKGLNYRAYSQGAADGGGTVETTFSGGENDDTTSAGGNNDDTTASGGDHTHLVEVTHPAHDHVVVIPSHTHQVTIRAPPHQHVLGNVGADASLGRTSDTFESSPTLENHSHIFQVQANLDSWENEQFTSASGGSAVETTFDALGTTESETSDASGDHTHSFDWLHDHSFDWLHDHDVSIPDHQHSPDPGIIDFAEFPSNCDVLVNGVSLGVSLGDGTGQFEEVVDLSGELTEGAWNTIEVTSDTLGHIQAHADLDCYRQILGDGGP